MPTGSLWPSRRAANSEKSNNMSQTDMASFCVPVVKITGLNKLLLSIPSVRYISHCNVFSLFSNSTHTHTRHLCH